MNLKIFKGFERFEEGYPTEAVKYALLIFKFSYN
jgi:hypothetical protein